MEDLHPRALVNNLNAPFWQGADAAKLVLPYCEDSKRFFWPPSPMSPYSVHGEVIWKEASPFAKLLSLVVYRRVFQKAFEQEMPYGIGLAELDAGPRLLVHLSTRDIADSTIVGQRVELYFKQRPDTQPILSICRLDR